MNSNFANRERIIWYSASTLSCRVGSLGCPLVRVTCWCVQLTRGEELHVAMLDDDFRVSIS